MIHTGKQAFLTELGGISGAEVVSCPFYCIRSVVIYRLLGAGGFPTTFQLL